MGLPLPLQTSFLGMVQDSSRELLPGGALWNCVDYIPEYLGSPLRKRGGWAWGSPALGSESYVDGLAYAPFLSGGEKTLAIGSTGTAYTITPTTQSSLGACFPVAQNPIIHRIGSPTVQAMIIPAASGTTAPKSYDGTTLTNLVGTPPQGIYAAVWNDRTLLANGTQGGTSYPTRVWFGPVGNAAGTWDTTNSWVDTSIAITGLGVLKTAILCFHRRSTERIKGAIPPTATAIGDLSMDRAFSVGCIDARSIVNYNDTLIWADVRGIYQTDGAALKDLTATMGVRAYWRSLLANYSSSYTVAAGVFNNTYLISVMNGSTFVDCLALDIERGFCYRLSNFGARCFSQQGVTYEEVYMGLGSIGRVAALSQILLPSAGNKNDADGTPVQPYFETGLFRGYTRFHRRWVLSMALQHWSNIFFTYDLRDAASDTPTLTMSFANDAGESNYTAIARNLDATSSVTRIRRDINQHVSGVTFKVQQTGPTSDTRISGLEGEYEPLESSRLRQ